MGKNFKKRSKYDRSSEKDYLKDGSNNKKSGNRTRYDEQGDSRGNHDEYWNADPQLVKDTARVSYSYALGAQLAIGPEGSPLNDGLPGVATIGFMASFGQSVDRESPINVAARNIITTLRRNNVSAVNYDANDIMIYICAMDSANMYLTHLKRIYGVMNTYSHTNKYYARVMVQALGGNYESIQDNLSDFRAGINILASKLNTLCTPATLPVYRRHQDLCEGLYWDSETPKAQTYAFYPVGYHKYELDADGAGMLKFYPWDPGIEPAGKPSHDYTWKELLDYGYDMVARLINVTDLDQISGDILRAFGEENIWKFEGVTDEYITIPSYQESIISQIHNATLMGMPATYGSSLVQSDDKGWLIYDPRFGDYYDEIAGLGLNPFVANAILSFDEATPDEMKVMKATRLTNRFDANTYTDIAGGGRAYAVPTQGTEIACYMNIYWFGIGEVGGTFGVRVINQIDSSLGYFVPVNSSGSATSANVLSTLNRLTRTIPKITQFRNHPHIFINGGVFNSTAGTATPVPTSGVVSEIQNYAEASPSNLKNMSQVALLSAYHTRRFGKFTK